jgi:hypothetical protein
MSLAQRLTLAVVAPLLLIIGAVAAAILILCHGHLIYSLDDPYISLALAQQIAHGHYGITAAEASSPSSSILYPFVLAGLGWTRWQEFLPAIVNTVAAGATGALFAGEFCRLGIVSRRGDIPRAAMLIVVLCLAINVVGLVFVGLEHSLHLLTSVFVVLGLARVLEGAQVGWPLIAAIVLLPLWRFEGLALAGLAIVALGLAGQRRDALTAAVAIAACLGLYMAAMAKLGLPLLPSSVLVKSAVARQSAEGAAGLTAIGQTIATNIGDSLRNPEAYPVFLLLALTLIHPVLARFAGRSSAMGRGREVIFVMVIAGALAAHILFGAWGWFARYEAYAVALGVAGAIVVWRSAVAALVVHGSAMRVTATAGILLFVGQTYVLAEAATPLASLGIYEQQYQMHRFAAEFYRRPVAVNDIGWVSYGNPNYVLDLWGLGSEEARHARAQAARDPFWLDRLAAEHGVGLAMIYDQWFAGQIPPGWRRIGVLEAAHRITAPFDRVSFYATSRAAEAPAQTALAAFSRVVGPGTNLTVLDPDAAATRTSAGAAPAPTP